MIGTEDDWNYVCNSEHQPVSENLIRNLKLPRDSNAIKLEEKQNAVINSKSIAFPYIRLIHFALHLLYEDLKLNTLRLEDLSPLMKFLNKLSLDLDLEEYSLHYWRDFPTQGVLKSDSVIARNVLKDANVWPAVTDKPPNVFQYVYDLLKGHAVQGYPYLTNVNSRSRDIVQVSL